MSLDDCSDGENMSNVKRYVDKATNNNNADKDAAYDICNEENRQNAEGIADEDNIQESSDNADKETIHDYSNNQNMSLDDSSDGENIVSMKGYVDKDINKNNADKDTTYDMSNEENRQNAESIADKENIFESSNNADKGTFDDYSHKQNMSHGDCSDGENMSNVKSYVDKATDKSNAYNDTNNISSDENLEGIVDDDYSDNENMVFADFSGSENMSNLKNNVQKHLKKKTNPAFYAEEDTQYTTSNTDKNNTAHISNEENTNNVKGVADMKGAPDASSEIKREKDRDKKISKCTKAVDRTESKPRELINFKNTQSMEQGNRKGREQIVSDYIARICSEIVLEGSKLLPVTRQQSSTESNCRVAGTSSSK